jgi:hypothetical protein
MSTPRLSASEGRTKKVAVQQGYYCPVFGLTLEPHSDADCQTGHIALDVPVWNFIRSIETTRAVAEKNYKSAQQRTFELSERAAAQTAEVDRLRDLLGAVFAECVPSLVTARLDQLGGVWRRIRLAQIGQWENT